MVIKEVSAVDKAANAKKFLIIKREEGGEKNMPGEKTDMATICKIATEALEIALHTTLDETDDMDTIIDEADASLDQFVGLVKAETVPASFAASMATDELRSKMWRATEALQDVVAKTLASADLTKDAKKTAISESLGQFTKWLMGYVEEATKIMRADPEQIQKAGAIIASGRLNKLKDVYKTLGAIIQEAEGGETVQKGGEDMDQEQLKTIIREAMAPIEERLGALEKGEGGNEPEPTIEESIKKAVGEALGPIAQRLEVVEKARGIKKSVDGQDQLEKKEQSFWGGVL